VHQSAHVNPNEKVILFGDNIKNINATLEGLSFDLMMDGTSIHFEAPLLGAFNATNITAAILAAQQLGLGIEEIQTQVSQLTSVEHRLHKIEAGGKLIIDDSFNGNLEGMTASYELVNTYNGRKVLITPGVVESNDETNIALAQKIDEVFDKVIITGSINAQVLATHIKKAQKIILKDKDKMQEMLANETKPGDIILFSNDAPTFM